MDIRRATLQDAERIAEIHVRSWQGGYRGLLPQEYLDGLDPAQRLPFRMRSLEAADWSRGGCLVVARPGGQLAGFADLGATRDQDDDPARVGEVFAIYLAPDAWGQGLGRALMTAALGHLAGAGYREATLWVLDTNQRARRFYRAAGFAPDGAKKTDQRHGFAIHEIRYRRPLP
ncbi:MAG TPA: GNAT family N-acetyltransferase [Streptosporangiaceae bacterium]|jgi:ribosomal protein S18 acetylase RimI-like enzyme